MDVSQDTFLKLYQQMNKDEYQIENPKAWLYKVAANKSLNIINTTKRQREIEQELEFVSFSSSNPESRLISQENRLQIKKAISILKPEHQILVFMYQDGLSYKEMSEATNIPFNSIGKTLWRSIDKISQLIKKNDHD